MSRTTIYTFIPNFIKKLTYDAKSMSKKTHVQGQGDKKGQMILAITLNINLNIMRFRVSQVMG